MATPRVNYVLAMTVLVAACNSSNGSGSVSVSGKGAAMTTASSGPSSPAASPGPAASPSPSPSPSPLHGAVDGTALVVTDGAATLRLERVVLAVREFKLEDGVCAKASPSPAPSPSPSPSPAPATTSLTSASSGDGSSHDGEHGSEDGDHPECEVELGPKVVSLDGAAFAATTFKLFDAAVPPGTYRELELKVCPLDAKSTVPGAAELAGASVVVVGSFQPAPTAAAPTPAARPFSLAIKACAELEREVAITVGADGAIPNLTLDLDPARWILDASGQLLDPSDPAGAAAITARLAAALDVYEDRNHDGHHDD